MIRPPDHRKFSLPREEKSPAPAPGGDALPDNERSLGTPSPAPLQTEQPPLRDPSVSHQDEFVPDTAETSPGLDDSSVPLSPKITLPSSMRNPTVRAGASSAATPPELPPFRPWNPDIVEKRVFSVPMVLLFSLVSLAVGALGVRLLPNSLNGTRSGGSRSDLSDNISPLTQADQDSLDTAFAANKARQFTEAKEQFAALKHKHPRWGSLGVELGRTQIYEHNLSAARTTFKEATANELVAADAHFNLGLVSVLQDDYRGAETSFAVAVALDPARPDFYYFWGESLRKEGKPQEASKKFRSALLRNQYETMEGLYRLKLWLSEIEADPANDVIASARFEVLLTQPRPPMEALFAAAARDIKIGEFKSAAARLIRARSFVEPSVYLALLQDPLFAQENWRPELAELYKSVLSTGNAKSDGKADSSAPSAPGGELDSVPAAQSSTSPPP